MRNVGVELLVDLHELLPPVESPQTLTSSAIGCRHVRPAARSVEIVTAAYTLP